MVLQSKFLAVFLLLTVVGSPVLGAAGSVPDQPATASSVSDPPATDGALAVGPAAGLGLQEGIDADDVLLAVTVHENGTATWRVEHRVRLDDENVTAAFEEVAADVEANSSAYRDRFAARMADTVAVAENATGREMAVRNVTVDAERRYLPQEYGVVVYTFRWTGFARTTDDGLRVGDALAGLFLDGETTLLIAWPEGYAPTSVSPDPTETRERAVLWTGPLDFAAGEPRVVLDADQSGSGTTSATRTTSDPSGTTDALPDTTRGATSDPAGGNSGGSGLPLGPLLGVSVLALVAGAVAFTVWRGGAGERETGGDASGSPDDASGSSDDGSGSSGDRSGLPGDESEPLLSNEERLLELLADRDGRLKQQAIVEELGWTEAKTSRVVNALREDGRVEVFRLGRENVVSLPDDDGT